MIVVPVQQARGVLPASATRRPSMLMATVKEPALMRTSTPCWITAAVKAAAGAVAIARVQTARNANTATSVAVTLGASPANGSNLIATINTTATTGSRVSSISQTGATWVKAVESVNASGQTEEIWYAEAVSGAGTTVTVNLAASHTCAVIVVEYSGLAASGSLDQTATNNGTAGGPDTGTTGTTSTASQLWVGGLGHSIITGGSPIFSSLSNGFTNVSEQATGTMHGVFTEKIVSATGTANTTGSYGSPPISDTWAGAMATFKQ